MYRKPNSRIRSGRRDRRKVMVLASLAILGQLTAAQERSVAELRRLGADVRIERVAPDPTEIWVDFSSKQTRDASLAPIAGLEPLTALRILDGEVTDRGLAQIRRVPRLWLLVVRSSKVTDLGVESISHIATLRKLDLIGAKLTKRGLSHLERLTKLERLFLYGAKVTDRDLEALTKLTWLAQLSLPQSTSPQTFEALKRALPKTQIDRD